MVAEVYRIPNTNELLSVSRYQEMVTNICGNTNQVDLILGSDMNFDYKQVGEHKNTSDLLDVFFSYGLLPHGDCDSVSSDSHNQYQCYRHR